MNKIRVLVQVIVMAGILTGCDSCDDGMDYPIVQYAQEVVDAWKTSDNQGKVEQIRLALKAYPDITVLEMKNGMDVGRIGNRGILGIGNLASLVSPIIPSTTLQQIVTDITTNRDNLSQLFGAPAGLAVVTDSPSVTTDSPAVITDDLAVITDGPAVITDSPAVITDSPAVITDGLAVITRG
jgi:hypothetical protein